MKIKLKIEKEYDIQLIKVFAGVRYWEDASVNNEDDESGNLIPCKDGDLWKPIIEVETGKIINWEIGKEADIHYKVCDQFSCELIDVNNETIFSLENEYVPKIMCPKESGYGDYIIMDIDKEGYIKNWNPDLSEFITDY